MGYMTEIGILNDRWDEIRKKPTEFVKQIYESSMSNGRHPRYIIGQTTVARTHHADQLNVYYAAENSFFEAYPERGWDKFRLDFHLRSIKRMREYLTLCEKETKQMISDLSPIEKGE